MPAPFTTFLLFLDPFDPPPDTGPPEAGVEAEVDDVRIL